MRAKPGDGIFSIFQSRSMLFSFECHRVWHVCIIPILMQHSLPKVNQTLEKDIESTLARLA